MVWESELAELRKRHDLARQMGGPEAVPLIMGGMSRAGRWPSPTRDLSERKKPNNE